MAPVHGRHTRVYLNALDVSGYLNSAGIPASTDTADITVFGQDAKTYIAGSRTRTHEFGGLYDKATIDTIETTLGVESGVLTHCPGGASAIGDLAWLSSILGTQFDKSTEIASAVAFSWSVQPSGPIAHGYVLHPLAEDTNTTTGATRDDTAATTTGWTGHLHATAIDAGGGSWVIRLQDSADGSAWADVSGGAFTAVTAATSQRLQSAAGATLRRYVRYVATRTGGSAGEGVTFVLALSRQYLP